MTQVEPFIAKILAGKRVTAVVGHFGSGKTEFSVSLAYALAEACTGKLALIDLDIANPYFRSRELKEQLQSVGVAVYGSAYGHEITAELPALDPSARAPLENENVRVIVDVGGDYSGAKILNQYSKYLTKGAHDLFCIVNKNRPETSTLEGALAHIRAIEDQTGLAVTGLVSNAHFVTYTTAEDILDGYRFTQALSDRTGIPLVAVCTPKKLISEVHTLQEQGGYTFDIMPMGLYMRASWLDRTM